MPEPTHLPNKRHFSRVAFNSPARISRHSQQWDTVILDISMKGALYVRPAEWNGAVGDTLSLEVPLTAGMTIRMEGMVVHIVEQRVGLHCQHIDVDSIAHLRRLIQLNLGDAELCDRELSAMWQQAAQ